MADYHLFLSIFRSFHFFLPQVLQFLNRIFTLQITFLHINTIRKGLRYLYNILQDINVWMGDVWEHWSIWQSSIKEYLEANKSWFSRLSFLDFSAETERRLRISLHMPGSRFFCTKRLVLNHSSLCRFLSLENLPWNLCTYTCESAPPQQHTTGKGAHDVCYL